MHWGDLKMNGEKICKIAIENLRANLKMNDLEINRLFPTKMKIGLLKNPILTLGCQNEQLGEKYKENLVCLTLRAYVPQSLGGTAAGKLFESAVNAVTKSPLNIQGISRGKMSICAGIEAICLEGTITVASVQEKIGVIINGKEYSSIESVDIKTKKKETNVYSVWESEPITAEERTEYFITVYGLPMEENWNDKKNITLIIKCTNDIRLIYNNCKCIFQEQKVGENGISVQTEFSSENFLLKELKNSNG